VTEANPAKRNLVLSRRAILEREKAEAKETLLASLEVGQTREGTVRSLQNFGAFVDLGGVDGLIHISQLSWDRLKHASEVLEVGQNVKVKIQKIDPQTGKISLAFRDLSENPWAHAVRDFPSRSTVKGTVSRLMDFGAFVRLAPGVEGLVHISELSHKRVFRVSDFLSEGQEVEVLVQSVDPEAQRISLSLKALEAKTAPASKVEEPKDEPEAPTSPPKKRKTPLKGGIGGPATGDQFGLKW
jgi:small subunit ribosomal protein S1